MSMATAFKYYRPFPFCLSDFVQAEHDYVGGLSLAQIMAVWWNLEELSIVTSGNAILADINNSFVVPTSVTVSSTSENSFLDTSDTSAAIPPRERVCIDQRTAIEFTYSDTDFYTNPRSFGMSVDVIIDPDDPELYGLAYRILAESRGVTDRGAIIANASAVSDRFAGTPEFSGNIDFGGISLPWVGGQVVYLAADSGDWETGGTDFDISITPSFFTY